MTADTYDPILGLLLMGVGNDNNSWGTNANNSVFTPAARAIAGVNTITATTGTVDLSTVTPPAGLRLDVDHNQMLTGALTGDLTVKVVNLPKCWKFHNKTTGSFNVYVQVPGGVAGTVAGIGGLVQIPQGKTVEVTCDGAGNLYRGDRHEIGTLIHHGSPTPPPGAFGCGGASLLRSEFPDLFNAIGTTWGTVDGTHFTLPNTQDTGRYLRSIMAGLGVGTPQSNQNQAHTHTQATGTISGTTDSQGNHFHGAGISDGGHNHAVNNPGGTPVIQGSGGGIGGGGSFGISGSWPSSTAASATGVRVNSANGLDTTATAGAHTHNVSGSATITLNNQGGTEARPESAAVLICIRY